MCFKERYIFCQSKADTDSVSFNYFPAASAESHFADRPAASHWADSCFSYPISLSTVALSPPTFLSKSSNKAASLSAPVEQLLSDMRLPAQLPPHGLSPQRKLTLRSKRWTFLWLRINRVKQIHPAIGALHQIMINIRAAIAAFHFVIFGWGSDTGRHQGTVSILLSGCFHNMTFNI